LEDIGLTKDTPHPRYRSPVVAVLDALAAMRPKDGPAGDAGVRAELNTIDRAIAIAEAAAARIKANDFSAVEALLAGQALALDAMFDTHARETAYDDIRLALSSQRQCQATFKSLMQMKYLRDEKFSRKRNEEPAKSPG
jgi:hypothetical protein